MTVCHTLLTYYVTSSTKPFSHLYTIHPSFNLHYDHGIIFHHLLLIKHPLHILVAPPAPGPPNPVSVPQLGPTVERHVVATLSQPQLWPQVCGHHPGHLVPGGPHLAPALRLRPRHQYLQPRGLLLGHCLEQEPGVCDFFVTTV